MRKASVSGHITGHDPVRLHPHIDVHPIPGADRTHEALRRLSDKVVLTARGFEWDLDRHDLAVQAVFECRTCCMRATFMGPLTTVGIVECPCGGMVRIT